MSASETLVATGNRGALHGPGSPAPFQARSERPTSYDVADFAVPNGREEEWRFTPVKTSRHCSPTRPGTETPKIDASGPEGVVFETVAADSLQVGKPQDRSAAIAWNQAGEAFAVRIPVEASWPSRCT